MTKNIAAACGIVALSSLTLAAQQSSQPTSQPGQSSSDYGKTVTVTGCLQSWDGTSAPGKSSSAPGSTASSSSAAAAGQFILTNVQHGASDSPGAANRSPAAATAPGHTFVLSAGSSGVNLSQHVNHKVQITGTTMAGRSGASSSPDSPGSPSASGRGQATPAAAMPTLNVTSLKMVSANCS